MLFDSHAHLDLMEETELKNALLKAKEAGVEQIVSCATSFYSNEKNLELAKTYPQIKPAIGLYPLDALELSETELEKAFRFFRTEITKAIAIGEVGLDYKYTTKPEDQERQVKILTKFISLSKKFNKPLILHSRFAQKQVLNLLIEEKAEKVLLHSFVDSPKLMKQATEKGYFVSVGLNLLKNEETQKNIKDFPLENLLFETDSPIRFFGEKAYPEKIRVLVDQVAQLKKITSKEVEEQTAKNFSKLFNP